MNELTKFTNTMQHKGRALHDKTGYTTYHDAFGWAVVVLNQVMISEFSKRGRDRDRQKQTDSEGNSQTDGNRLRQRDKDRQRDRKRQTDIDRDPDNQTDRQAERQPNRHTLERQTCRQMD